MKLHFNDEIAVDFNRHHTTGYSLPTGAIAIGINVLPACEVIVKYSLPWKFGNSIAILILEGLEKGYESGVA